jgi:hypothetical protein
MYSRLRSLAICREEAIMNREMERGFTPPYNISFRTFLNFLQKLEGKGMPTRIDRSILTSLSGQAQTYLMGALRSFGLIDEHGDVLDGFENLALKPNDRPKSLAEILRRYYPKAVAHGEKNGTLKQLEEIFGTYGLGGDTLRKATTFYLHAAEYAKLPISRFVKVRKVTPRKASGSRARTRAVEPPTALPSGEDQPEPLSELRRDYIKTLMDRAFANGEPNADLLDRVERLLGYDEEQEH